MHVFDDIQHSSNENEEIELLLWILPRRMLYNGIRKPCRRTLTLGSRGPQIQAGDGSLADGFVLEFGSEIDVFSIDFADAKRLRGLLGERLYEQVIGSFFVKYLCDAKDKQSSEYVGQ